MSLLDKLRPRWHHSDPEVRLAAVRDLEKADQELLVAVAQHDTDARVRRVALKKLTDSEVLLRLAAEDADEGLRRLATERAATLLAALAASGEAEDACARALERIGDPAALASVAMSAVHPAIRRAALERVRDERGLAEIARAARDDGIRRAALARVTDIGHLRRIATGTAPADISQAAAERIDDPHVLDAISKDEGVSKRVRHAAQQRLDALIDDEHPIRIAARHERQVALCAVVESLTPQRDPVAAANTIRQARAEFDALAARTPSTEAVVERFRRAGEAVFEEIVRLERLRADKERWAAEIETNLAAAIRLCEEAETVDGADVPARLAAARSAWGRLGPLPEEREALLADRFVHGCHEAERRHERWHAQERFRHSLEEVVQAAETTAEQSDVLDAEDAWPSIESRWKRLAAPGAGPGWTAAEEALRERFLLAGARLRQREHELAERNRQRREENLTQLRALCTRLEALAQSSDFDLRAADQALHAFRALGRVPPLPSSESRKGWQGRLAEARRALFQRLGEHRDTEAWRRWANADVQETLVQRVEALLDADDIAAIVRELRQIQEDWKRFADVPREQSQALWERYCATRDEVRRRVSACFAENLREKGTLCERVEQLAESTAWKETSEEIKRVQAEWKQIGPVSPRVAGALWQRFRAPCDQFFGRRNENFARVKAEREENVAKKIALCETIEGIAESIDWEATTEAIRRLQVDWKSIGPTGRKESEALWERFRAACDRFFERRRHRGDIELQGRLDHADGVCVRLESLLASLATDEAPDGDTLAAAVKEAMAEWTRVGPISAERSAPFQERVSRACEAIFAARPDALRGTPLDPDASRKRREKLVVRLEELVQSLTESPKETSLADLAAKLKQTWAANTIGGGGGARRKDWRGAGDEVERLRGNWERLGPALGDGMEALARRFNAAYAGFQRLRDTAAPRSGDRPARPPR